MENKDQFELQLEELENISGGFPLELYKSRMDELIQTYNDMKFDRFSDSMKIANYQLLLTTLDFLKKEAFKEYQVEIEPTIPIKYIFN